MTQSHLESVNNKTAIDDVRMRGFKKRSPVEQANAWLDKQFLDLTSHAFACSAEIISSVVERYTTLSIDKFNNTHIMTGST